MEFMLREFIRNRVAALSTAIGLATDWNPNADDGVFSLTVPGDTIYAGGPLANIGGQARNHIAALSAATGQADMGWDPNAHSPVRVLYPARSFSEGKKVRAFLDPLTRLRALVKCPFAPIGRADLGRG
jgi:hypothetical protein